MECVSAAHAAGADVIGGALVNDSAEIATSVAHYLFEFSVWLPLGAPRAMAEVPGGTMSVARSVFERCGPFPDDLYSEDGAWCEKARELGVPILFMPSIH